MLPSTLKLLSSATAHPPEYSSLLGSGFKGAKKAATSTPSALRDISLGLASPGPGTSTRNARNTDSFARILWPPAEDNLIRRSTQGDPLVSLVKMSEGKAIEVQPGKKHTLFTYGLDGCQALLLLGKHPNGKKIAILTHYPPESKSQNLEHLQQLIQKHPELKDDAVKLTSVIVVPGAESGHGIPMQMVKNPALVESIQSTIKAALGKPVAEVVLPYSQHQKPGSNPSSAFIIHFPAASDELIQYEACGTHSGQLAH